jgi:hypothetical protein
MIRFRVIFPDCGFSDALLDGQLFKQNNVNVLGRFCIDN